MSAKSLLKASFAVETKCEAYFTGRDIQITRDGEHILCECGDSVGIVSVKSGQITSRITCEEDQVTTISLSPDNTIFVIALKSTVIQQYQWPSRQLTRHFRSYHRGPVVAMAWDTTSTLLVTGGADSAARVWDLHRKYCTHSIKADGVFGAVLFDRDLAVRPWLFGAVGNNIYIWKLLEGSSNVVGKLEGHHSTVTAMSITDDGTHLVSCGLDRVLVLWSLETMSSVRVLPVLESISTLLLNTSDLIFPGMVSVEDKKNVGIYAMIVGDKGTVSVWAVEHGKEVWRSSKSVVSPPDQEGVTVVNHLIHSASLESVVMTTFDHSIIFTKSQTMDVWKQLSGYNDQIVDCVFVGADDSHLVVATNSVQLRIYNCADLSCQFIPGHTAITLSLSRHPQYKQLFASSSHDKTVRVWRLGEDNKVTCIARAEGHLQTVGCVALAQDFFVTGSKDLCVKRWKLNIDAETLRVQDNDDDIVALTSTHTAMDHDKDINSLCVSVNNKLIATASQDRTAKIWDSSNLTLMGVLRGHRRGIWSVQFSPVDEIVATASADATIKIWTLSDYSNVATLEGHSVSVLKVAWLSHGLQLLSSATDGLLKLWTVKGGLCLQTYDEHDDKAWALTVSQDQQKVVTGGEDAKLVWWKDVTTEELQKAQEEAQRLASEEQTLMNLMKEKKWHLALVIAIKLGQPHRGLNIIKQLLDDSPEQLGDVINRLRQDQISSLLTFAVQWNTKTKHCREAQRIVNILLNTWPAEKLEELADWSIILEGLLPYTERHFKRTSALCQASTILSYMTAHLTLGLDPRSIKVPDQAQDTFHLGDDEQVLNEESEDEGIIGDLQMDDDEPQEFSLENLDANYEQEKIVARSSDEDSDGFMENNSFLNNVKRIDNPKSFSLDQLELVTKHKNKVKTNKMPRKLVGRTNKFNSKSKSKNVNNSSQIGKMKSKHKNK